MQTRRFFLKLFFKFVRKLFIILNFLSPSHFFCWCLRVNWVIFLQVRFIGLPSKSLEKVSSEREQVERLSETTKKLAHHWACKAIEKKRKKIAWPMKQVSGLVVTACDRLACILSRERFCREKNSAEDQHQRDQNQLENE